MMKNHRKIIRYGLFLAGILLVCGVILSVLWRSSAFLKHNKAVEGLAQPVFYEGKHYEYKEELVNILCLGIDHDEALDQDVLPGNRGQSDAIFLISLNSETREMKILNIPRDLMMPVKVYDVNGDLAAIQSMQIALQYAYGSDEKDSCLKTAEDISALLLDIPIHRYCAINFNAVSALNDAVGGVSVRMDPEYVDAALQMTDPLFVPGDTVHLMGEHCFHYLHIRDIHTYASCEERAGRQKQYIKGYVEAAKEKMKKDRRLLPELYSILDDNMTTDIRKIELPSFPFYIENIDFDNSVRSIEGTRIQGEVHEEFYPDQDKLYETVVEMFYTPRD